jgi:serine/threonine protein kinase
MHNLESGPIAHGDVKLVGSSRERCRALLRPPENNILVDSNENALICDFGRSRQPDDQPNEAMLFNSSPFAGTVRYMSPELLETETARPSPAADMWAYGCIALEVSVLE